MKDRTRNVTNRIVSDLKRAGRVIDDASRELLEESDRLDIEEHGEKMGANWACSWRGQLYESIDHLEDCLKQIKEELGK